MFKSVFCDIIFAMNRKIDYKINENDTGKTVEGFLKEHGYTHQVLVRLKQTDHGIQETVYGPIQTKGCVRMI